MPNAVFTECPSNPLLATPDFRALRALADQHDLLLIVDATIGNMYSVEVLPYADIVIHSLSKIFSGRADVTGGRYAGLLILPRPLDHSRRMRPQPDAEPRRRTLRRIAGGPRRTL